MPVEIGGEKAWLKYAKGDLGVAFHWINDEPAMVLYPLYRRLPDAGAFVICLSVAFQYVNSDGHPNIQHIIPRATEAAETMGFAKDPFIIKKIVDVICDAMPDLINMPPEPNSHIVEKAVQDSVGEMSIKVDGNTVVEKEISALEAAELSGAH